MHWLIVHSLKAVQVSVHDNAATSLVSLGGEGGSIYLFIFFMSVVTRATPLLLTAYGLKLPD